MYFTFIIFTKNKPGVLYRIADLFLRRKINIESLTVAEINLPGISRFTILVDTNEENAQKIAKQLYRIIEVLKVIVEKEENLISKEVALIKVFAKSPKKRSEIEDITKMAGGKIESVGEDYIIVEKTGTEQEIQSFFNLLRFFGILDFVRSGRISILKEKEIEGKFSERIKKPKEAILKMEISGIKKFEILASKEKGVISFAQGIPDFETPAEIKKAAFNFAKKNLCDKYTSPFGIQPLREVIAEKLKRENNLQVSPENIIVTHGAIEGLMSSFLTLFEPEDEILVLTPDYASHITQLRIIRHGAFPLFLPLKEEDGNWKVNFERLENSISHKTKGILICNPSNPLGKVYSKEELEKILEIAQKHNLFIICDEVYEYFVFDGKKHISIASLPGAKERTITVFSLSKSYSMTGWRIGYLVAEKDLINEIVKVHDALITCPTAISQYAALEAIKNQQKKPLLFKKIYQKKRDLVCNYLRKTKKLTFSIPEATYYIFPKINAEIDDIEFCQRAIREAKIALVPGSFFGPGGENHFRLSFGKNDKDLKEGLKRLVNFVEKL
jgi:aminotransferase